MSSSDGEVVIARGIKLLMSNDSNSEEELRKLLEEVIKKHHGPRKAQSIANLANENVGETVSLAPTLKRAHSSSLSDDEKDLLDIVSSKKLKINEASNSASDSPTSLVYNTESSNPDDEDELTMEIVEDNECVICKSVISDIENQVVECLDCHDFYHQNCAMPPIEADVNDPRFVWYCETCNKNSNKGSPTIASSSNRSATDPSSSWSSNSSAMTSSSSSNSSSNGSTSHKPTKTHRLNQSQGSSFSNKQLSTKYNKLFKNVKRSLTQ